jgi:hypothetical protein
VALFREKEWLYGALAMVGCVVVIIAILGLAPMPK